MRLKVWLLFVMMVCIPVAFAFDECKPVMTYKDIPCSIFVPINQTTTNICGDTTITYYRNNTFLSTQVLGNYSRMLCNTTFIYTALGIYDMELSNGDTAVVTVQQDFDNYYYLYIISFILALSLIWIGYKIEDIAPVVLGGFVFIAIGISLNTFGFPFLTDYFLIITMTIVFIGIGMLFAINPLMDWFEGELK